MAKKPLPDRRVFHISFHGDSATEWYYPLLKSGKGYKQYERLQSFDCCEIRYCEMCGKCGGRRKIIQSGIYADPVAYLSIRAWRRLEGSTTYFNFLCRSCHMTIWNNNRKFFQARDIQKQISDYIKALKKHETTIKPN